MRPPFPGMDPWLEHPALWPDVHNRLIAAMADAIVPLVDPRYYVSIESRMTLYPAFDVARTARPDIAITSDEQQPAPARRRAEGVAIVEPEEGIDVLEVDVPIEDEVEETNLEIHELQTHRLVTVLEILSPANKSPGRGRVQYLARRTEVLNSASNLIEMDLLRGGEPMPLLHPVPPSSYRILISRDQDRPRARLYAIGLRAALPKIPIPLLPGDEEPTIDLTPLLHDLIDRARYFRRIDYTRPPVPPLRDVDVAWVRDLIATGA